MTGRMEQMRRGASFDTPCDQVSLLNTGMACAGLAPSDVDGLFMRPACAKNAGIDAARLSYDAAVWKNSVARKRILGKSSEPGGCPEYIHGTDFSGPGKIVSLSRFSARRLARSQPT